MADVDGAIDKGVAEMRGISKALLEKIQALVHEMDTKPGSAKLDGSKDALANADRIRNQIVAELKRNGEREMLSVVEKQALIAAKRHLKNMKVDRFEPNYQKIVADSLKGIKDKLAQPWADAAESVRRAMRRSMAGGLTITVLLVDISSALEISARQAQTVVDTAINGVASQALLTTVEKNPELAESAKFEFIGARTDGVTRPFCRKHLGDILTIKQIRALQREQGTELDVFVYGGGYNCRHRWVLVFDEDF